MPIILEASGGLTGVGFVVRNNALNNVRQLAMIKGQTQTITVDYAPWAEDNGDVTAAVAAVKSGNAGISNESLTANLKTLVITTANAGGSMISLTATAGNNVHVLHIRVFARDPEVIVNDYGFVD